MNGAASEPPGEWAGPWASDAQRLFTMLRDIADRAATSAAAAAGSDEHAHANAAECRYCPICAGLVAFRRSGPEALDRVAELAAGLAATLRATDPAPGRPTGPADERDADEAADGADGAGAGHPGHDDEAPGARIDLTVSPIQRIDISD